VCGVQASGLHVLFVVPFRIILMVLSVASYYLVLATMLRVWLGCCSRGEERARVEETGVAPCLRTTRWCGRCHARVLLFAMGFHEVEVRGAPDPGATLQVSNHSSFVDIVLLYATTFPSFVAKSGVRHWPVLGDMAIMVGTIFVHSRADAADEQREQREEREEGRGPGVAAGVAPGVAQAAPVAKHGSAAIAERIAHLEELRARGEDFQPVHVFPEGSTTNACYVIPFRSGAFRSAAQRIQPVVIRFEWDHFSPTWETVPMLFYYFRLISQVRNRASITFLPAVRPEPGADPAKTAEDLRQTIAAAADLPLLDVTVDAKFDIHRRIIHREADWRWWLWRPNPHPADPADKHEDAKEEEGTLPAATPPLARAREASAKAEEDA
jgi:lysophosphatidylcholine acyltransferase / lyso-PAF acetyltransferase